MLAHELRSLQIARVAPVMRGFDDLAWLQMSEDEQQAFCVYSVGHRDGKDDDWLKIGLALPHLDGKGFDVMLQAFPLNARLVVRAIAETKSYDSERRSLARQVEAFERALIERCLMEAGGNISAVMDRLDIPRRTLNEKMTRLGIDRRRLAKIVRPMSANDSKVNSRKSPIQKIASSRRDAAGARNITQVSREHDTR